MPYKKHSSNNKFVLHNLQNIDFPYNLGQSVKRKVLLYASEVWLAIYVLWYQEESKRHRKLLSHHAPGTERGGSQL